MKNGVKNEKMVYKKNYFKNGVKKVVKKLKNGGKNNQNSAIFQFWISGKSYSEIYLQEN